MKQVHEVFKLGKILSGCIPKHNRITSLHLLAKISHMSNFSYRLTDMGLQKRGTRQASASQMPNTNNFNALQIFGVG